MAWKRSKYNARKVVVDGHTFDSYEKDGQSKWMTRVICQRVEFLESKHDDRPAVVKDAMGGGFGTEVEFKDEDLPF